MGLFILAAISCTSAVAGNRFGSFVLSVWPLMMSIESRSFSSVCMSFTKSNLSFTK